MIFCKMVVGIRRDVVMSYDKALIARKLYRWETFLNAYTLPKWEDIPDFGLYMDQVITLLTQHLDFLPREDKGEALVTPTAINNYVRLRIMPAPEKKRYRRVHLAYLFIICTLKQTMTIAQIQKIIPVDLSKEEVQQLYTNYVIRHARISADFIGMVRQSSRLVCDLEDTTAEAPVEDLVTSLALMSGYCRLLAEKIVELQDYTADEVIDGEPLPKK